MPFELLERQRAVFGVTTARARIETARDLSAYDAFCRERGVGLAIARAPLDFPLIAELEDAGFRMMELMQHLAVPLARARQIEPAADFVFRAARANDLEFAVDLARRTYGAALNHYAMNGRLGAQAVAAYYEAYVRDAFAEPERCFIAEATSSPVGLMIARVAGATMTVETVAVEKSVRRRDAVLGLIRIASDYGAAHGATDGVADVDVSNAKLLAAIASVGLVPAGATATLHRWYA